MDFRIIKEKLGFIRSCEISGDNNEIATPVKAYLTKHAGASCYATEWMTPDNPMYIYKIKVEYAPVSYTHLTLPTICSV